MDKIAISQIYNESLLTICPTCCAYPFINIHKENNIEIKCENCSSTISENIHKYLNIIKDYQNFKPMSTSSNESSFYCESCRGYISPNCNLNDHQNHSIINLNNLINTSKMKQNVKDGYEHVGKYCKNLRDKGITKIKSNINELLNQIKDLENTIHDLEKSYQSFQERSIDVLSLMNLIINNYEKNHHNYHLFKNLDNLKKITIYEANDEDNPRSIINYYDWYSYTHQIISSDKIRIIKDIPVNDAIQNIIKLKDGKIAYCGYDEKITIIDPNNNYKTNISIPVGGDVFSICQIETGQIVSCANDLITFWTVSDSNYACEHTIKTGHSQIINHLVSLSNNRIASTSYDRTIKIWEGRPPYNCLATLKKHKKVVYSGIQIKGEEIFVSASEDDILCIWDLQRYQLQTIIAKVNCRGRNALKQINNNQVIVGGSKAIFIVDIQTFQIINQIIKEGIYDIYGLMIINENLFIFGNDGGEIGIYDKILGTITKKKLHHNSVLGFAELENNKFISCSYDCTVKVLSY